MQCKYGDVFLSATSAENRKRLQILQNKGLRCALNKNIETSNADLHAEANLLQLIYRREQHELNLMYDFAQLDSNRKSTTKLSIKTRSSNKLLLKIKRPYTEIFKKSLCYAGLKKWNALPEKYHRASTKPAYMSLIKDRVTLKAIADLSTPDQIKPG